MSLINKQESPAIADKPARRENKLWHDVQNEETLICAKFSKDLFNISKVIGCKKVAQFF